MSLELKEVPADARDVLREELTAFALAQPSAETAQRFHALASAIEAEEVPDELVPALETFLELSLHRGRLRRQRGPEADEALAALFFRTPGGAAARKAAHDVSRALGTLSGQVLERISVGVTIGGHTIEIRTDRAQLTLELDRGGARVRSIEVGP